ncbi:MAG: CotH kinase family protein, partial [Planctomycetota bacterium]
MSERIRISLLALVTTVSLLGPVEADYPVNDLDPDTHVFAEQLNQRVLPLAINEFMASNRSSKRDPQGQYDDWIEIHNYGADALDVGGMYLTDNLSVPIQWPIPGNDPAATTIPAGGYLLIWADNDAADPGLHANFRLNAGGEEIGLFDTDGATLIDSIVFPDQSADVSFGRFPDANDEVRFFGFPSPEAENSGGYLGEVADLKFSRDHGFYDTPFSVTIATETKDVTIFYSTDGSEPGKLGGRSRGGTEYTGPVPISRSTALRAIAVKTGWKSSNIPTQTYAFLDPDVGSFSSNLPIVVIDTFGQGVNENAHALGYASFIETGDRGRIRLAGVPDFTGRIGIDVRGKSSTGFAKKQYHFETWNENNKEKNVSLLGFPAESDWVLQGPYSDKSLMRNYLSYNWSNDLGQYASRTKFIEVFLNSDDGRVSLSDYVGVYILMEKIKRNKNRVDIAALDPADDTEPQITGGYIFKKDKLDSGEPTFNTSTGLTLIYVDPNGFDITEAQKTWLRDHLIEFEAALNGPNS